jgi:hypothetical protein
LTENGSTLLGVDVVVGVSEGLQLRPRFDLSKPSSFFDLVRLPKVFPADRQAG